jgi:hypothetical protein
VMRELRGSVQIIWSLTKLTLMNTDMI